LKAISFHNQNQVPSQKHQLNKKKNISQRKASRKERKIYNLPRMRRRHRNQNTNLVKNQRGRRKNQMKKNNNLKKNIQSLRKRRKIRNSPKQELM